MQKTLQATYKAGNGRRLTKDFPFTVPEGAVEGSTEYALAVSTAVSNAAAYIDGRGGRIVNWKVV